MKKVFVSLGLAAGAAGLTSAFAQQVEMATPKMWNVSSSLRGFYDDNYTLGTNKKGSWGWEFSPSVSANADLKQTDFGIRYTFGMYYYVQRSEEGVNPLDYTHQADLWLDHSFNETTKLNVSDSVVVAQDPQLVQGGAIVRVNGNNVANHAQATLSKEWTRQFSTATHYNNDLYVYADGNSYNNPANPTQAALLNRMEQSVGNDFQWQFQPETMGFIGYQFSFVRYTRGQEIAPQQTINSKLINYYSDSRDYNAHYVYVGVEHQFSPNLTATAKAGASYVDLYNDPLGGNSSIAPYADINATYTYLPGSYVQAGFRQDITSTSVAQPGSDGQLTQYQETSLFYFDITHQITEKLTGTLISQYSYQSFKDGAYNGEPANMVDVGVNLNYQLNRHWSAEVGYNFDELFSDVPFWSYHRNRVYFGLNASY